MPLSKRELQYFRSLSKKKVREEEGKFLLEGWRPLQEALGALARIDVVLLDQASKPLENRNTIFQELRKRSIPVQPINTRELELLSNTIHSQGVLAVVRKERVGIDSVLMRKPQLLVAADAVSDPGNLGSIIRTCDWFGIDTVLLGKGCVELYNEKVLRSTAGSIFHIPIVEDVDLPHTLKKFKESHHAIITLSGDGEMQYTESIWQTPCVLVFGSEAHGVSEAVRVVSDAVVRIPQFGSAESLNVGVACGIVLAHVRSLFPRPIQSQE
jgi:TrmH family RNA methyltransferase